MRSDSILYLYIQMKVLIASLVVFLACMVSGADDENARLLISKNILNELIVEGKDLTVEYTIFNVGGRYVGIWYYKIQYTSNIKN